PAASELIAAGRNVDEVQEAIGADWLIYQDLEDLADACREGNKNVTRFESSVFDGNYITSDVDEIYLRRLEHTRNDAAKQTQRKVARLQDQILVADPCNRE
ncbi:MAG: amidophosphoribosyltransferase, partial [Gammaproteobacteria bacterium]|nr:amidophosphoribosyltransferase [Gammaproteobacteria bacterium]